MDGVAFFAGAGLTMIVLMIIGLLADNEGRTKCAKENNVYDCKLVETWVPLPPTK